MNAAKAIWEYGSPHLCWTFRPWKKSCIFDEDLWGWINYFKANSIASESDKDSHTIESCEKVDSVRIVPPSIRFLIVRG